MDKIKNVKTFMPGLIITIVISAGAVLLQTTPLFSRIIPLSPLILAILLGMCINNALKLPANTSPGINIAAKNILRLAIILLGFRLSIREVLGAGPRAIVLILICTSLTIIFTLIIGKRLGLPKKRALLLASGISICGASAVAAVDGVIQGKKEDTAFAIGIVTIIGTLYMALYPLLYTVLHLNDTTFALWAGSSIHEVAQVAAAASTMTSPHTEALASTVKMIRVLFIIPFSFVLLLFNWKESDTTSEKECKKNTVTIPYFAILFFCMVILNSVIIIPEKILHFLLGLEKWLMTIAMSGLGLGITLSKFAQVGKRAFTLGLISSIFISLISALVLLLQNLL